VSVTSAPIERQPAHGSAGMELLRDRYKAHTALLKYRQQAREVAIDSQPFRRRAMLQK
jgi:hypothetical protein